MKRAVSLGTKPPALLKELQNVETNARVHPAGKGKLIEFL